MPHIDSTMARTAPVIALHCSGAGAGQWRQLGDALASRHDLVAPEHYGCDGAHRWRGERAFTLAEILAIAARVANAVVAGDYRAAAASFVDYWSGGGAWAALRPSVQAALTRWMPKAPLDFRALIDEPARMAKYADLGFPVLINAG